MCREYSQDNGSKKDLWYRMSFEAKILFGENLVVSFDTEFIENNEGNAQQLKQDCETKHIKDLRNGWKRIFRDFR